MRFQESRNLPIFNNNQCRKSLQTLAAKVWADGDLKRSQVCRYLAHTESVAKSHYIQTEIVHGGLNRSSHLNYLTLII